MIFHQECVAQVKIFVQTSTDCRADWVVSEACPIVLQLCHERPCAYACAYACAYLTSVIQALNDKADLRDQRAICFMPRTKTKT